MINTKVELLIPIKPFFKTLELCKKHSAEKRDALKATGALKIFNHEENLSVPEYTRYVFDHIDSVWKNFKESKSTADFAIAESVTQEYLAEWISILTWLLNAAVTIDGDMKSHFNVGFKQVLGDFQLIFDRLKSIFEYAYELSYTGQAVINTKPKRITK
jgi:hypothetical protein